MKKIIRKLSNCTAITFNKEEKLIYDIEVGDVIDIEIKKDGS